MIQRDIIDQTRGPGVGGDDQRLAVIEDPTIHVIGAKIRQLARDLDVQEMAVVTWTFDETVRLRSYDLLAQEFAMIDA